MRRPALILGFLCFLLASPASASAPYKLTFLGYGADMLAGVEDYIVEFPGYESHRTVGGGARGRQYEYRSGVSPQEIAGSLRRMFLYLDMEGGIEIDGTRITVIRPGYVELLAPPAPVEDPQQEQALLAPPKPEPTPPVSVPLTLRLTTQRGDLPSFVIGEKFDLTVELSRDAWLYCYYHQVDGTVVKFFPNPEHKDARMKGGTAHRLPGDVYPFDIAFTEPPGNELLTCYATDRDVRADLPPPLREPDFAPLPPGLDGRLHALFDGLANTEVARASLPIAVKR